MTAPRTKSELLSETAKSHIKQIAKEDFYGYQSELTNKYVQKGLEVESKSIDLFNSVFFKSYTKNTIRKSNEFLTGECDIITENSIIDIKSSWSLDTFPAIEDDINIKDYEMQLRGYMMLYDVDSAMVCYCMVDTPEHLCKYENEQLHKVAHIDPVKRVTTYTIERDKEIEQQIKEKCLISIEFYTEYINKLNNK